MIRVSLSLLVLICLLLMVLPVLIAWLVNEYRRGNRERAAFRHVIRCRICAFEWRDVSRQPLPICPRCNSLNERVAARHL